MKHADAERLLLDLIAKSEFRYEEWADSKFVDMKLASPTEKGNIGEDLLASLLRKIGYRDVEVLEARRGDYDVIVKHGKSSVKFEVKAATLDTTGIF